MFTARIARTGTWAGGMLLAATVAFAQTPPPASPTTPPTPASPVNPVTTPQAPASNNQTSPVTITGCVQKADSSTSAGLGYVLKNGVLGGSGATTGAASATAGPDYNLTSTTTGVQLGDHVGHQVEVKGVLMPSGGAAAQSSAQPGSTLGSTAAAAAQTLTVTSVKMLSSTCSAR